MIAAVLLALASMSLIRYAIAVIRERHDPMPRPPRPRPKPGATLDRAARRRARE